MKARLTLLAGALVVSLAAPGAAAARSVPPVPDGTTGPPPPSLGGLTMVWDLPIHYPRQVPLASSGQTTRISVTVTSNQPVTINARSYDGGLAISDPQRSFPAPLTEPTVVSFDVSGLAPGFHSLDVQMDGSVGPPYYSVAVAYGFVWTTGSPLPPATAATGRQRVSTYGYQTLGSAPQLLTFVSHDFAYLGLPASGVPTCTQEGAGCVRWWSDPGVLQTVQVGTGIVGAFHRGGFYTDGFVPPGPATGTPYGRHDFVNELYYVGTRTGLHTTYSYADRTRPSGLTREKVTLQRRAGDLVGDYRLSYAYAGGPKQTLEGTFRTTRDGAITFRDRRGRVVQRGTLLGTGRALPCAIKGTCRADRGGHPRGIWLILSGRKGNHPDGNLLQPVR